MARDSRSFWARLHWWDKLEMVGAALIFLFIIFGAVAPVTARGVTNVAFDSLETFFSSLG